MHQYRYDSKSGLYSHPLGTRIVECVPGTHPTWGLLRFGILRGTMWYFWSCFLLCVTLVRAARAGEKEGGSVLVWVGAVTFQFRSPCSVPSFARTHPSNILSNYDVLKEYLFAFQLNRRSMRSVRGGPSLSFPSYDILGHSRRQFCFLRILTTASVIAISLESLPVKRGGGAKRPRPCTDTIPSWEGRE